MRPRRSKSAQEPLLRRRVQQGNRKTPTLNPTIRKRLIAALKNTSDHLAASHQKLSSDFKEIPLNGKCHQRVIREFMSHQPEPNLAEKTRLTADFMNASVLEIKYEEEGHLL